jgi:tRNA synthetases class I (I, L, M and V)
VSQTADPRTDQRGSPDFPTLERQVLDYWASDDTFCASIARRDGASEYVFYHGPPFTNGLPHYGHLLTGYVTDICWPGHGLPRTRGCSAKSRMSSAPIAGRIWWACAICRRSLISWTRLNRSQVLPADFVSTEDGTGIVHTTPPLRRNQGLPATAITRGVWAGIGRGAFLAQGGRTTMITPAEGAQAFQSRLRRNRSYTGYAPTTGTPWLTALAGRSPFRKGVPSHGRAEPNGHNHILRGAGLAVPGRVAHPASASGRRASRPYPSPHRR